MVSSCPYFPWMMDVNPLFWCLSTVFQTLDTHGQVVSTISTFWNRERANHDHRSCELVKSPNDKTTDTCQIATGRSEAPTSTHLLVKVIHFFVRCSKGGQDDDISFLDRVKVFGSAIHLFNELDIHGMQFIIDFRIVNEFVGNVNFAIRKVIDGFVGQGNGSFDTPAESKVLRNEKKRNMSINNPSLRPAKIHDPDEAWRYESIILSTSFYHYIPWPNTP